MSATDSPRHPNPTIYRSLMEKLNILTHTRPDLSYSVQSLTQHMQKPTLAHFDALTHTLGYIFATLGQGILLSGSDHLTLQATPIRIGVHAPIHVALASFFSLVNLLSVENLKSNLLFLNHHQRPSIVPWLMPLLKLFGSFVCFRILV